MEAVNQGELTEPSEDFTFVSNSYAESELTGFLRLLSLSERLIGQRLLSLSFIQKLLTHSDDVILQANTMTSL